MHSDDPPSFRRLQSDVDQMFLELIHGKRLSKYGKSTLCPNADVYYDSQEETVVVKLELAGINPDEIMLEIENNTLRVCGTRYDNPHPDAIYQQIEIDYGRFERTINLPRTADTSQARASYNAGFLEIIIPDKTPSSAKIIPIGSKELDTEEGGLIS